MKFSKVAVCIFGGIVLAACVVLVVAAIAGRPLKTTPVYDLEGVEENVQGALWYASLAANSHNAQMWNVILSLPEKRVVLSVDENRSLNVVDEKGREAVISLGCYVETMCVAFDAFGYDTQVEYADKKVYVSYSKRENAKTDQEKIALLEKRHTDKAAYKDDPVAVDVADQLLQEYPSMRLYQNGEEKFSYLKRISAEAVASQSADQEYRDELAEWLRFSDREAADRRDGLSADMMRLQGIVKSVYYWTTTRKSAQGDGFAKQGIATADKQLNHCGAFAVFTGKESFEELLTVGRTVQAFWFDCTERGIAVQPFSAALETEPFCEAIQGELGTEQPVQMILRLGYVDDYGQNSGLRRPLSDYIEVSR